MGGKQSSEVKIPKYEDRPNIDDERYHKECEKLKQHAFGYENIVLKGGGAKGYSYCGAIRVSAYQS